MRHLFDQSAKMLGRVALDLSGPTLSEHEIARDAQRADLRHDPDPAGTAERASLGLLGRIAEVLCIIEVFGHAPSGDEILACLGKHIAHTAEVAAGRRSRSRARSRQGLPPEPPVEPRLWIIAPVVSAPILRKLRAEPAAGWPRGVYLVGDDLLRVGIVAASELPRDRSTLLVRLMAAGPGLAEAVRELGALPEAALEHTLAEKILLRLHSRLFGKPDRTPEEEEFIVAILSTWTEARAQGRDEGRVEGEARALLAFLRGRGISVPDPARDRILAERDPARLERWIERASVAASLADVLGEPS